VQKFGGTSVGTQALRENVCSRILEEYNNNNQVVVVVSAIGRKGQPYSTDSLIDLYNEINYERSSRELDLLMSCGEIISSTLLVNTLKKMDTKAVALTGFQSGIITDNNYGNANVISVDSSQINKYLDENYIVVVTGFQGITEDGNITTLGRGGSDTTAAVLGDALNADEIRIYTDVDGIMTADPKIVKQAQIIDEINYDEIYQMAIDGAKVIDHKAVEIAKNSGRKIKILNSLRITKGTLITKDADNRDKLITAITEVSDLIQVKIHTIDNYTADNELLIKLEDNDISIDLINFSKEEKMFTTHKNNLKNIKVILDGLDLNYSIRRACSKVTIVGHKIHGVPGVMKRIVMVLNNNNIDILQTSDSNTTIACLIPSDKLNQAMNLLHEEFKLSR
jgi:aspartate kinase